jgi:glycerol-3-phosphate cytidylyltransferase
MITRISPDKNILDAIKILSKLDNNTKLLIVGDAPEKEEAKPYKNEVLDEIKKYNLQDRVIITGHVNNEDVIKYASCFNVAINTSPSEGLPISLLEQMSIGIHCVYPSHGEIPLVLSGCGSVIEMKQRKSFDHSSDDYIFSRFKDFEIDMFVNEIKSILNKNTIDKNKIIERIKYHRSSENAKYYLDFLYGGYKEGVSFVIRARNEILNIQDCIDSISDIADEIIFVDHLSTDGTYEKALELSKIYDNLKVFRYDREIPKPGPNYQNNINILGNSIAQYYNFCLSKSTRKTIFKWDADFIANRENLNKLITSYSLRTRDDKFSMWFTGETVFIKDEKKYINKDSFYDEYRGFSLSNGVKWEDAIRCEYVDRKYANSSIALRFEDPCFYEIKRLNIDEFEHREGLIDERDRRDFQIIQDLQLNNIPSYLEEIENLNKKVIITYGTFDTFHFGHMEIIKRAKKMGDYLIVGISTDSFNLLKNKVSRFNYEQRKEWIESIKQVDLVIPEESWEQKADDIRKYKVNTFIMGDDWKGKFDNLPCDVVYLPRTENISSTEIKKIL